MFCNKCGNRLDENSFYCNKCGNHLETNIVPNKQLSLKTKRNIYIGTAAALVLVVFTIFVFNRFTNDYYFSDDSYEKEVVQVKNTTKTGKYQTSIIYDNTYSGVDVKNVQDANKLIVKDSVTQKDKCSRDIKTIEDNIINKYGITAVNLCEMNVDFAREIGKVFEKIYKEFPKARGYLTNMTLVNAKMSDGYIAAFMPVFTFATSSSTSTYPWVIKTQLLLNTTYFLNKDRLESSMNGSSSTGHFPPNSTIYSPIAHELGHYLSFLAMMDSYDLDHILLVDDSNMTPFYKLYEDFGRGDYSLKMIKEAYEKYIKDTGKTISLDAFRGTISKYAVTKDNDGKYIYDETIAEAFHDTYLNGSSAKDASKYIVSVLKEKLGGLS